VELQVAERVDRLAVETDLEMEVRTEAVAGAADVADHLALRDVCAAPDREAGLVRIGGREAAAVVDDDDVPVALLPAGHDDCAGRRGVNRRPVADADVDPFVHAADAGQTAVAEGADDGP